MTWALLFAAAAAVKPADLKARPAIYAGRAIAVTDRCLPLRMEFVQEETGQISSGLKLAEAGLPVLVDQGEGLQLTAMRAGAGCRISLTGELLVAQGQDEEGVRRLVQLGARNVKYYLHAERVDLYISRCPPGPVDVFAPAESYKKVFHPSQLAVGEAGEFEMLLDPDAKGLDDPAPWKSKVARGKKRIEEPALCARLTPGADRPPLQLALLDTPENRAALDAVKAGGRLKLRGRSYGVSNLDPVPFFAAVAAEGRGP